MVHLPGGRFTMGSNDFYPEEAPAHEVTVGAFSIDRGPVTVADFMRFVNETGYVTVAERPPDPAMYPDADPSLLVPGSVVFHPTPGPVPLDDPMQWWRYIPGAHWRAPAGPGTTIEGREQHPVTQVAYEDARSFAQWAGKDLPTEAEWEFAARGGLDRANFAWGDEIDPGGTVVANTWRGQFPWQNVGSNGHAGTSPVGAFPANGYGLFDVCGNVWEWTRDLFGAHEPTKASCCGPVDARGVATAPVGSDDSAVISKRVIKGGSHLCAPNYCLRFRPAARQAEAVDTATTHIGFRCVTRS